MSDRIQLYVGCAPNGLDGESQMVLEYTAKKYSSLPIDIVWMQLNNDPISIYYVKRWDTTQWATPFSGFRWSIPEVCNFEGEVIYMDSDMIILSDLTDLWNQPFEDGKVIMGKGGQQSWRFCVAKWNNVLAKQVMMPLERIQQLPNGHQRMMGMFANSREMVQPFEGNWNCVDGEGLQIEEIDCLHYSDMSTQFHLAYANERLKEEGRQHWFDGKTEPHWREDLQELFEHYYDEAIKAGYNEKQYYTEDVEFTKESQANYNSGHKGI